jgi:hypothetical protein
MLDKLGKHSSLSDLRDKRENILNFDKFFFNNLRFYGEIKLTKVLFTALSSIFCKGSFPRQILQCVFACSDRQVVNWMSEKLCITNVIMLSYTFGAY